LDSLAEYHFPLFGELLDIKRFDGQFMLKSLTQDKLYLIHLSLGFNVVGVDSIATELQQDFS